MALLIIASAMFIVMTTIGLSLRLYTRKFILNLVWIDDYLAIIAWVCLLAMGTLNFILVDRGLTDGANSISIQKMLYAGLIFSNSGQLFTKLTYFFQFYRIVRNTGSPLRVPYICIITVISCWLIAQIIISALPCIPVESFWDKTIEGYCPDSTPSRWMSSIGNIVTDFVILLLPVPVIWRLRIARGQKLALVAVFGLGFFICIISILRLVLSLQPPNTDSPADPSPNITWTMAEFSAGLLLACLATLRALIARFLPSWRKVLTIAQTSRGQYAVNSRDLNDRSKHTATTIITSTNSNWISLPDESTIEMGKLVEDRTEQLSQTHRSSTDWPGHDGVKVVREFEIKST